MSKAFDFSASNLYAFIIAHLSFHSLISSVSQVMANEAERGKIIALKTDVVTWNENVS